MKTAANIASLCLLIAFSANLALAEAPLNQLTDAEKRSGWKLLFDGKSTDGWRNYKKDAMSDAWKVDEGALVWTRNGAGDIVTDKKYSDFELTLEYKISKGGNSGLMFHVVEGDGPPWHSGPEIQVQDNVDGHDPQKSGWLYQLYKPTAPRWAKEKGEVDATRPAGEWNQLYVRIAKDQCEVCMNGVRYYTFKLGDKSWQDRVAKSKFSEFEQFGSAGEGHICLQDHGNVVAYRNIKLRELGEGGSVPQPIDGKLEMKRELAFPNLKWDKWEPVDEDGNARPLRLMELTYAEDGSNRLFAASQNGGVWAFENKPDVTESHLLLDLRGAVHDWKRPGANEQGLLGLAIHPDFKSNGLIYVYYSHPSEPKSVVAQYKVVGNKADESSAKILMEIDQPYQNHNGGAIEFGPDGYLYLSLGDGGDRNDPQANGQNLGSLLGKILRIDVDNPSDGKSYGIPADNPFVDNKEARPEIFALGLRNPWRIAFDSKTADLWVGDVGQELWEEVNVVTKGGNYGWSTREGSYPFGNRPAVDGVPEPIGPVWEYDHRIGKSITGGRVYRSSRESKLSGKYLYADYVTGTVWALSYDHETGKATRNEQVIPDSIPVLAFGEDQQGEVYFLTNGPKGDCIYRFSE